MHAILYGPENRKKQGTKKADKDITSDERGSQEAQQRFYDSHKTFVTNALLIKVQETLRTLKIRDR